MKHRGADSHQRCSNEHRSVAGSDGEREQSNHGDAHAHGEGVGLRAAVGVQTDDGLEQGSSQLRSERNAADLPVVEMKSVAQHGVDGRKERLHRVVQQVAKADGKQNGEDGASGGL